MFLLCNYPSPRLTSLYVIIIAGFLNCIWVSWKNIYLLQGTRRGGPPSSSSSLVSSIDYNTTSSIPLIDSSTRQHDFIGGIKPRVWSVWSNDNNNTRRSSSSFPCFDPGNKIQFYNSIHNDKINKNHSSSSLSASPFPLKSKPFWQKNVYENQDNIPTKGLLFVKPMKVGGSTATGIQLRISKNIAKRQNQSFVICENSYDHSKGHFFQNRDKQQSFLWSLIRDPTDRAISSFWHMHVGKRQTEPTYENFVSILSSVEYYYIATHMIRKPPSTSTNNNSMTVFDDEYRWVINDILQNYNFIGISERFDESMIVLNMLLPGSVPLGDMLYMSAKVHGGYDNLCYYIQPNNLTTEMQQYIKSDGWKERIRRDQIFYDIMNASLDKTIDVLGRSKIENTLVKFQQAQQIVSKECLSQILSGCTSDGKKRISQETNCLFQDSACAYECIDRIATQIGIGMNFVYNFVTLNVGHGYSTVVVLVSRILDFSGGLNSSSIEIS